MLQYKKRKNGNTDHKKEKIRATCDWTEQQLVVKMVLMRFRFVENV